MRSRKNNSKCLVHCKMGVSRSASTVIAYAMKEYGWSLDKAYNFVKQKRSIAQPNAAFMRQLAEYEGILDARWEGQSEISEFVMLDLINAPLPSQQTAP